MNTKQKAKRKQVSFNQVYKLACTDSKFLNALLKNRDKALRDRRIALSKPARKRLDDVLDAHVNVKGGDLLQYLNKFYHDVMADARPLPPPPPPPWDIVSQPGSWEDLKGLIRIENRKLTKELIKKLKPGPEKPMGPDEKL